MLIRFYASLGLAGAEVEEDFEFDDDTPEERIEEEFRDWLGNQGERGWYRVD